MTANDTLIEGIARRDAHPALVDPATGDVVTYTQLADAVHRIASQLAGTGVGPGDVVALSARNGPAFVLAFLGVIAAGAAAAPLNPAYTAAELHGYLTDTRPGALLVDAHASEAPRAVAGELDIPVHGLRGEAAAATRLDTDVSGREPTPGVGDSVALLLHTSGTTSRPKCVPLRQRNLARSAADRRPRHTGSAPTTSATA